MALNMIFNFINEIKAIAFFNKWIKKLLSFEYVIWILPFWFCWSFSSSRDKRQELYRESPLLFQSISWHFTGMSHEKPKPISLVFCAPMEFSFSISLSGVLYTCLSKLFLLCCVAISETLNWQQLFFRYSLWKLLAKKELLIKKKSILIQNTGEIQNPCTEECW